ncbi:MAG: serine O-acetyltransferase EpsC [Myxococcota bacterium]|jgi:serine O-acetyltransferase|nr:serine O-acetyltransferase EpsC [Myxococcota bacterium]
MNDPLSDLAPAPLAGRDAPLPPPPPDAALPGNGRLVLGVVEQLCANHRPRLERMRQSMHEQPLPSRQAVLEVLEALRCVLFPGYFGHSAITMENMAFHVGARLDRLVPTLEEQIRRGLCFACVRDGVCQDCTGRAAALSRSFIARLPEIQRLLATDVRAAYEGDPAAISEDETIICYPGLQAITNHRLAHELYRLGVPLIPRIINEYAHSQTGIDIHPGATIGRAFFIDHGTGVVIGETSVIGDRVRVYQGVTLGAKSFPLDAQGRPIKGVKRHPHVEDDVVIYSGATILGTVTIGRGSVIGGNVWLTHSVPPGSRVAQAPHRDEVFQSGAGI